MANSSSSFLPGCCPGSGGAAGMTNSSSILLPGCCPGLQYGHQFLQFSTWMLPRAAIWPPVHPTFYLDVAQGLEVLLGLCVNVKSFPLRQAEFCHHPNQSPDLNGQYRIFKLTNITAKIIIIQPFFIQQQKPKKR
jgi:hypothetical protein